MFDDNELIEALLLTTLIVIMSAVLTVIISG